MSVGKEWENYFKRQQANVKIFDKFRENPVPPKEFFEVWMRQPLSEVQLQAVEAMFTPDFQDLSVDTHELLLLWGEGAGKDFTSERMLLYVVYWLECLKNPWQYLRRGDHTQIDLVNTSVSEKHAKDVWFVQFCEACRHVINPHTGNNWFEELGMDIREGKAIQKSEVRFPNLITAHSTNAQRYAGEGKNILLGVLDEIAEFKYDKAKILHKNIKATANSRFPQFQKVILLSYLRDEHDYMNTYWNQAKDLPEEQRSHIFFSKKCTWEVNPMATKDQFAKAYADDPEDSKRRYENIIPSQAALKFIKQPMHIIQAVRDPEEHFFVSETPSYTYDIQSEVLAPWVMPGKTKLIYDLEEQIVQGNTSVKARLDAELLRHKDRKYFIHIDLAAGAVDYAGIAMCHAYLKTESKFGYYVDFATQIRPEENKEIDFGNIREFIFKLKDMGFCIGKVTLDGSLSKDFIQEVNKRNILCELQSVDRTTAPYDTFKDLLYQDLVSLPSSFILMRELNELIFTGTKIDHPAESVQRYKEERKRKGSKDLADSVAGCVFVAMGDETNLIAESGAPEEEKDPNEELDDYLDSL